MTPQRTPSRTSRNLPGPAPRINKERAAQDESIEHTEETEDKNRDLVHGDGGSIDLPTESGDLSKDD